MTITYNILLSNILLDELSLTTSLFAVRFFFEILNILFKYIYSEKKKKDCKIFVDFNLYFTF